MLHSLLATQQAGTGLDLMKFYHDNCVIKHGATTRELDIGFQEEITVGKFVDIERPTYVDSMNKWYGGCLRGRLRTLRGVGQVNEIRISGFGGQGVIRCGYIIGKTAALFDGKHATLTQSFGPEARGSACSAQIIVRATPVRYPYLTTPDTVVAMSQEAFDKFGSDITRNGTLMIDDDLVKPETAPAGCRLYAIPATRIAEELGNRIAGNIVMLGFFTAITDIISVEAADARSRVRCRRASSSSTRTPSRRATGSAAS